MVGFDLTRNGPHVAGRAIMQYGENQAYLSGDQAVILRPGQPIQTHLVKDGQLDQVIDDATLHDTALAHARFASWAYDNKKYTLNDDSKTSL